MRRSGPTLRSTLTTNARRPSSWPSASRARVRRLVTWLSTRCAISGPLFGAICSPSFATDCSSRRSASGHRQHSTTTVLSALAEFAPRQAGQLPAPRRAPWQARGLPGSQSLSDAGLVRTIIPPGQVPVCREVPRRVVAGRTATARQSESSDIFCSPHARTRIVSAACLNAQHRYVDITLRRRRRPALHAVPAVSAVTVVTAAATPRRSAAVVAIAAAVAVAGPAAAQGRAGRARARLCRIRLLKCSHSRQSAKPLKREQRSNLTFVTSSCATRGTTGRGQPESCTIRSCLLVSKFGSARRTLDSASP